MKNITYISAGAGSGKTYKLTELLSEKLAETNKNGEAKIKPSQVILTTFTELAASEFREKARQKLLDVGNLDSAAQLDSAAIGTVHSVALRFIKKFWYLLGYGADIQTISERDEDFYITQSLARLVSERDENGILKKQKELEAFRAFRDYYDICDDYSHPDYLFWQRYLKDIVEKMEYYNVDNVEESISKSLESVNKIFYGEETSTTKKEDILSNLANVINYLSNVAKDKAIPQSKKIKTVSEYCQDAHELSVLISVLNEIAGGVKTAEKNCQGYTQLMADLQELTISSSNVKIMAPFIEAIFRLAKEWRDDFVSYKERNHIISYNDMERLFLHLISNEQEVIDYIRDNYRLIMVDEFQDSNPIQLKIFNKLSEIIAPADGHSFWVGDPKQAIYGFRGADTNLVNSVSKHFKFYDDDEIHPEEGPNNLGSGRLVESWRSRQKLVELVNDVFKDKFEGEMDPLCITLKPHFTNDDLESDPLEHWHNEKAAHQRKVKPEALAWKVKQLLSTGMLVHSGTLEETPTPIRPKDFAILCRKNNTIKDVVKAMRKYNIPVSESEDAIMQRIEVQLIVTLLQFAQNPNNKHNIADLMRLLWGYTTKDILQNRIDYVFEENDDSNPVHFDSNGKFIDDKWMEDSEQVKELIKQIERIQHLSIPEMVRAIIYECNIPAIISRWGESQIRKQNLSTIQHLADDYDQMCLQMGLGTSISGFIYYLNSIEPDNEKDNQSDTVKVYTYHGSKGLEWPIVILNELNEDTLDSGTLIKKSFMRVREIVLKDNSTEQDPFAKEYYLHFIPNIVKGSNGKPSKPMVDIIKEMEIFKQIEERTRSEERRLLYVGMTRAKDFLYTTGIDDNFKWLENVGIVGSNKNNVWGNQQFVSERIDIVGPSEDEIKTEEKTYSIANKPEIHTSYDERYISPSKIENFNGFTTHCAWKESGTEIDTHGWGKDYATIGSCIHDIFAAYKKGDDDHNHKTAINIMGGYGVTDILSGHIEALIRSADWLYNMLQEKYPQTQKDRTERELPFTMTLPSGNILRGDMDLLWYYTDNEDKQHCVLVDYKTFRGVDLNEQSKSHYAQLSAYATALKDAGIDVTNTLIYYPVHSKIHELK